MSKVKNLMVHVDGNDGSDFFLVVESGQDLDAVFTGVCIDTRDRIRIEGWNACVTVFDSPYANSDYWVEGIAPLGSELVTRVVSGGGF
jgi:hypothetical protein